MRALGALAAAAVVGLGATGAGYAVAAAAPAPDGGDTLGPGSVDVVVTITDSRFAPDAITVWEGTQIRFEVRNTDPIGHELVVGGEDLHGAHEGGTEAAHPPVPGEVSLGAGQTGATVFEADEAGRFRIVCHLPRHEAYGMVGEVVVLERP